jgi:hypothetical protein
MIDIVGTARPGTHGTPRVPAARGGRGSSEALDAVTVTVHPGPGAWSA